jgi:hypothetical protein
MSDCRPKVGAEGRDGRLRVFEWEVRGNRILTIGSIEKCDSRVRGAAVSSSNMNGTRRGAGSGRRIVRQAKKPGRRCTSDGGKGNGASWIAPRSIGSGHRHSDR